ncbi:hypothetical protein ONE63_006773 [Megalurothrips usitatus]|uniref:Uncharacterized protein n=1 Tax=Megalurothrips usitatus TaxID=439358 RepID=A0AAV7XTG4_9NEOP|nr:hypothetical protein ONE63_006773 [Megalurothrips usitatus]
MPPPSSTRTPSRHKQVPGKTARLIPAALKHWKRRPRASDVTEQTTPRSRRRKRRGRRRKMRRRLDPGEGRGVAAARSVPSSTLIVICR